jgi:hypothetical protein
VINILEMLVQPQISNINKHYPQNGTTLGGKTQKRSLRMDEQKIGKRPAI